MHFSCLFSSVFLILSYHNTFHRLYEGGILFEYFIFMNVIQHYFICRPSDSTVSEDAGIEPRTVANLALAVRLSNHSARSHDGYMNACYKPCKHNKIVSTNALSDFLPVTSHPWLTCIRCIWIVRKPLRRKHQYRFLESSQFRVFWAAVIWNGPTLVQIFCKVSSLCPDTSIYI